MTASHQSPSPSPPPEAPKAESSVVTSFRYDRLRKLHASALRATLATNSYPNFASCFPTPAKYCPRALEGVWKQLNTRLEAECSKDFDKICQERDIERSLALWERLLEEAKERRAQHVEKHGHETSISLLGKPMHMLTAEELHAAHLAPTLVKAEQELQSKLDMVQQANQDILSKIEGQRAEMQLLVEQLEQMVEDVEGATKAIEEDGMREELRHVVSDISPDQEDAKMTG